jgi:hypothetical protein
MGIVHIEANIYVEESRFPRSNVMVLVCDRKHPEPRRAGFIGAYQMHQALKAGWKRSPLDEILCPECAGRNEAAGSRAPEVD